MLYLSRLFNACGFVAIGALILTQRDEYGAPLISGYHGLGLAGLLAIIAAILNFRGAMTAAYLDDRGER